MHTSNQYKENFLITTSYSIIHSLKTLLRYALNKKCKIYIKLDEHVKNKTAILSTFLWSRVVEKKKNQYLK